MPRSSLRRSASRPPGTRLLERVAGVIREQMLAVGARLALAPVLDVARDPRWGRVGRLTVRTRCSPARWVPPTCAACRPGRPVTCAPGVIATGKHFLAYAMSEGGRNWNPVQMGPRAAGSLRRAVRRRHSRCRYPGNIELLCVRRRGALRGQPCYPHRSATRRAGLRGRGSRRLLLHPAALSRTTGLPRRKVRRRRWPWPRDSTWSCRPPTLWGAVEGRVEAGRVSMEVLDTAVRRMLALKFQLGLFEEPYVDRGGERKIPDAGAARSRG